MKPISIKMQAFGPYLKPTVLDFSTLYEASIFLISGPTGGGKTTILDAMSFALYGKATGAARAFRDMRCIAAGDNEDTATEFTFSLGDKIYRFRRTMHIRIKRNGEKDDTIDAECSVRQGDDWHLLESGHDKVIKKAEEILGFNHEQFSQVIVLPQGEFRRLLLANSKEKSKILEVLFSTSIWQKVSDTIGAELKAIGTSLADLEKGETVLLESTGAENFEQLFIQLEDLKKEFEKTSEGTAETKKNLEKANAELTEGTTVYENFEAKKTALERIKRLDSITEEIAEDAERLKNAQKVKNILPYYNRSLDDERILEKRNSELKEITKQLTECESTLKSAQEKSGKIPMAEKNEQDLREQIAQIRAVLPDAKQFAMVVKSAAAAKKNAESVSFKLKLSEEACKKLEERIFLGEQWVSKSFEEYKNAERDELINNFAAKTAAELREGDPCPVCGSVHHPKLALPLDLEGSKTSAEAKAEHTKYEKKLEQLKAERVTVAEQIAALNTEFSDADRTLATAEATAKTIKERIGNAGSFETLSVKLKELSSAADNIAEQIKVIRRNSEEALSTFAAVREAKKRTEMSLKEAEEKSLSSRREFENAMLSAGFEMGYNLSAAALSPEQEFALEKKLKEHETMKNQTVHELDILNAKLAGKSVPDILLLQRVKEDAQMEFTKKTEQCARLDERLKLFESTAAKIETIRNSSENLQREYSAVCRVSDLVSGKNAMKTPLHNFVLGLMLDDVVFAASRYLQKLSRGRYSLVRADYSGGAGLRGLDIEVTDAHTGGQRKAGTLSGGELFLASLSLAFGLAEVVQSFSGGVKLDSIFIDEGFGTLDSETLEAAMKSLADIQSEGRLVGIISHVSELKSRIPARIEVSSGNDGSTLLVKGI